jgi:hypothetical protein
MQAISIQNVEPAAPPQGVVVASKAQSAKGARSPFAALLAALRSGPRAIGAEASGGSAEAGKAKGAADAAAGATIRGSKPSGRSEAKLTTDTIIARSKRGPAMAAALGEVHADAVPEGAALSGAADLASRARSKAGPRGAGTAEVSLDAVAGETSAAKRRAGATKDKLEPSAVQPQLRGEAVFLVGQPRAANAAEAKEGSDDRAVRGEGRRRETKRSDAKYSVIDLRMAAPKEDAAGPDRAARAAADSGRVEDVGLFAERGSSREATTPGEAKAAAEPQGGASFKEALAQRLEAGTGELVRAAQLVLKDGDLGLIRLRLEPESLGGVKIELKLAEKQISGRIVVESDLAAEAFRSSLDSLRDAFAEAGFDARALDVEIRGDLGGQAGQGGERDAGDSERGPYWSARLRELDAAVPPAWAATESALNLVI